MKELSEVGPGPDAQRIAEIIERADILAQEDEHESALGMLAPLVAGGDAIATFNYGNSLLATNKAKEAVRHLRVAASKGVFEAWLNLGHAYIDLGKHQRALAAYIRAAAHGDMRGRAAAGWILWSNGQRDEARHLLSTSGPGSDPFVAGVLGHLLYEERIQAGEDLPQDVIDLLQLGQHAIPEAAQDLASVHLSNNTSDP